MNPFVKQAIFGAILFVAGVSFGWIIGTVKTYQETAGIIAESGFKNAATGLDQHVTLLHLLHAKDHQPAVDKLEALVDADLVMLAQYPTPIIPSEDKIVQSIIKTKEYREKYPVTGRSAEVTAAIGKAFEKTVTREAP